MTAWPIYHAGERMVQKRVGVEDRAAGLKSYIRPVMPQQHMDFFAQQSLFYVGARDASGQPWASVLVGPAGFVSAPDERHLLLKNFYHHPADPVALALRAGSPVGGLGLDLATRRRNRVNGTLLQEQGQGGDGSASSAERQLLLRVDVSFGNCPKYIQARHMELDTGRLAELRRAGPGGAASGGRALGPAQLALIAAADTFFVATAYSGPQAMTGLGGAPGSATSGSGAGAGGDLQAALGCDVSHRGGPPGFVCAHVEGGGAVLRWPDYAGNNMFQTLGNLAMDARAGVLFVDWESGDVLQLAGRARTDYDDRRMPGAQRSVVFEVDSWLHARRALPIRQVGQVEYSPYLPHPVPAPCTEGKQPQPAACSPAGAPDAAAAIAAAAASRQAGTQLVDCVSVVDEAEGIKTFEFKLPTAHGRRQGQPSGEAVPSASASAGAGGLYRAGQYAVFEFDASVAAGPEAAATTTSPAPASASTPATRTWTITSLPSPLAATFTISVKRAGVVSSYLHDKVAPGSALVWRAFGGEFTSDLLLPLAAAPSSAAPAQGQPPQAAVALLLAGGIGITPVWAVLQELARQAKARAAAAGGRVARRVVVVYSVRHAREAAFLARMRALGGELRGSDTQLQVVLLETQRQASSADEGGDASGGSQGGEYVRLGGVRLSGALLQQLLGQDGLAALEGGRCDAMVCGPPGFMAAAEDCLAALRLPAGRLHREAFDF